MHHQDKKPKILGARIQRDAEELFFGSRTGHLGYMQYGSPRFIGDQVQGANLWSQFRFAKDYYLAQEDDVILAAVIKKLAGFNLNVSTLVDLGPGDFNALTSKTLPLLESLGAKKYISVDMCESYALESAKFVAITDTIESQAKVHNFLEESLDLERDECTLLFMGGSTISNVPVPIETKEATLYLSAQLARLRHSVGKAGFMLLGFDANQDEQSLNAAYREPLHGRLVEDIVWRIARDTKLHLNPKNFQYHGEWLADEHRYAHSVITAEECLISLGERSRSLPANEVLHLDNSYKFPVKMFVKAAENANWQVENIWTETGRAHYILLKAG